MTTYIASYRGPNGEIHHESATAFPDAIDPTDGPNVIAWAIEEWGITGAELASDWSVLLENRDEEMPTYHHDAN